jgi:hypothetical protein
MMQVKDSKSKGLGADNQKSLNFQDFKAANKPLH